MSAWLAIGGPIGPLLAATSLIEGIRLAPSYDKTYVEWLMFHDEIYPFISDDKSKDIPREDIIKAINSPVFEVIRVFDGATPCGAFVLEVSGDEAEMHTLLLPNCRGAKAIEAGKKMIEYMFQKRGIRRVFGFCFSDCKAAIWFTKKIGLKFESEVPHHNTRGGKSVNRVNFSITN